ncbi:MAG: ribonuclease III [Bacteroidia bacterium]|nr:ribonuclease III [Bacteroidia bacterium]
MLKIFSKKSTQGKADKKLAGQIYNITGVRAKNISLYHQALRHSSAAVEIKEGVKNSNERLEFLGDAVLGIIVAEYLFKMYPFKGEGFLTKMRSRLVNRAQLNQLSVKMGLNELIESDLKGNRAGSIHGDAFEALVGAIYLDQGFIATQKFILNRILKLHFNIKDIEETDTDYKSRLLNWGQHKKKKIVFEVIEEKGPPHNKVYTVQVKIDGAPNMSFEHHSKRRAEQLAAQLTLEKMEADGETFE